MLKSIFSFIGRLYTLVMQIILAGVLGILTWASWGLYQDEKLASQFRQEGQFVSVKVEDTSNQTLTWRDYLGNISYLSFHYHQKAYIARFVMDTVYVGTGDQVALLYHPELDAFRQASQQFHFKDNKAQSRLIRWSVVSTFHTENRWLVICLFLSGIFGLFASGVLAIITNWDFFGAIGRLIFGVMLLAGAAFFTFDSWEYYQYYQKIKNQGQEKQVKVLDTHQRAYANRRSRHWKWYFYTARVRFDGQERIIPLEEADYETLQPGDSLPVLYNQALDDLMPVNYPIGYRQFLTAAFLWIVTGLFIWKKGNRSPRQPTANQP